MPLRPPWPTLMGEDVAFGPTGEVKLRPCGKKIETSLRELHAPFALQHLVERVFQPVKIGYVIGGISELLLAQSLCAPIRALLLLR